MRLAAVPRHIELVAGDHETPTFPDGDVLELELVRRRLTGRHLDAGLLAVQTRAVQVAFAPNTAGIALRVPDVESAREGLTAKGVEFLGDTVDTGVCHMGVYDPNVNVLILHRRYAS
jgi:hypothetical protein